MSDEMKVFPAAWLHEVVQDDGEADQALSFSPDSFPLQGVGGFRSVRARPLYTAAPSEILLAYENMIADHARLQQQLAAARESLQAAEAERDSWHHAADTDLMKWRDAEETLRRLRSQEVVMSLATTLRQARHYVKHAVAHAPFAGNNPEVPMAVLNNVDAAISWLDYSEITAATLQRDRQP